MTVGHGSGGGDRKVGSQHFGSGHAGGWTGARDRPPNLVGSDGTRRTDITAHTRRGQRLEHGGSAERRSGRRGGEGGRPDRCAGDLAPAAVMVATRRGRGAGTDAHHPLSRRLRPGQFVQSGIGWSVVVAAVGDEVRGARGHLSCGHPLKGPSPTVVGRTARTAVSHGGPDHGRRGGHEVRVWDGRTGRTAEILFGRRRGGASQRGVRCTAGGGQAACELAQSRTRGAVGHDAGYLGGDRRECAPRRVDATGKRGHRPGGAPSWPMSVIVADGVEEPAAKVSPVEAAPVVATSGPGAGSGRAQRRWIRAPGPGSSHHRLGARRQPGCSHPDQEQPPKQRRPSPPA